MSGHVFVCKADLTKLACDAWLLPTNAEMVVRPYWMNQCLTDMGVADGDFSQFGLMAEFGTSKRTALPKIGGDRVSEPIPILTVIDDAEIMPITWYLDGITAFVDAFFAQRARYLSYRVRPLLSIPLVGTGKGGASNKVAVMVVKILSHCQKLVEHSDVDIAISLVDPIHYSIVQMERRKLDASLGVWSKLSASQKDDAQQIANHIKTGKLVLFLGAGVSAGAGLPSWGQLIAGLADMVDFPDPQRKALESFNFLDQAEILGKELSAKSIDMNVEIVRLLSDKKIYSLAHALVSDWPCDEAVTQNYDTMFEMACRDSRQPLSVIPYSFEQSSSKWLLKMHGCVTAPEDIVLSRSDYLDYDYTRSALSSIVQALLVTKHMLFLGFSLTDDHFIQLMFGVHRAIEGMVKAGGNAKFGTVLTPIESVLQEDLWQSELNFVSSSFDEGRNLDAYNWHDVLLDYVTNLTHTSHQYLFHHEYDALLTDEEIALRDALDAAHEKIKVLQNSDLVREFEEYLRTLGKMH